ncbi:DUF6199 family natural product biosynthesis protein [Clostridium algidicarnis]|uniref:DUF6199 family natural product biosynthesis protein n=1 Tax=Clostridium algidicarnis TaxID=37659 RepID=UPI001C0AF71E|nr:DUF6199 family natural product biosynthesis protein [Clostridium algidicarnis]MBU3196957.1 hypothetical protein [Clostridium algidicarnis]MBU3210373.1 hypothetical protein [Clostridium algidicarnis]MBU3228345.1 hypothetical protein [Clostridium algidicarnis]MBU3251402.1 hypothetical protein [Clostridium algidicarnis]
MVIIFLLMLTIGILEAIFPKRMLMLGNKNECKKEEEPSDFFINITRIGGVILIIIAITFAVGAFS